MLKLIWRSFNKKTFDIDTPNITVYDYHVTLKSMLIVCGAADGTSPRCMVLYTICALITTTILIVTSICSILSTMHVSDISAMAESIIYLTFMVSNVLTILAFRVDRKFYKKMKNYFEESFLFITSPGGKTYRKIFYNTQLLCSKLCLSQIIFHSVILFSYILQCFTNLAIFYIFAQDEGTERPLTIPAKLPNGLNESETPYYEIIFVITFCFAVQFPLPFTSLTYMPIISVAHLVSQLDMVISDLECLFRNLPDGLGQEAVHQALRTRVKVIVDRHNRAYEFLESMAAVYKKWFAFFQLASIHMGFISAYAIQCDLDKGSINYLMFLFLIAVFSTLLVLCWGMTIVAVKFEEVGAACFNADWCGLGAAGRAAAQDLRLILLRSHQPLRIRMAGFNVVNLEEFLRLTTAIYTYFNMLRQRQ